MTAGEPTQGMGERQPEGAPADVRLLRRIERRSLWLAALATGAALAAPGGGLPMALGIASGAVLALLSYWAIKRGVGGLADRILARSSGEAAAASADQEPAGGEGPAASPARPRTRVTTGVVMFVFRHALLLGMAYVMIARLRLPPLALLGGASVIVIAAAAELVRPTH